MRKRQRKKNLKKMTGAANRILDYYMKVIEKDVEKQYMEMLYYGEVITEINITDEQYDWIRGKI